MILYYIYIALQSSVKQTNVWWRDVDNMLVPLLLVGWSSRGDNAPRIHWPLVKWCCHAQGHNDVIMWTRFPHYWPFVWRIHLYREQFWLSLCCLSGWAFEEIDRWPMILDTMTVMWYHSDRCYTCRRIAALSTVSLWILRHRVAYITNYKYPRAGMC